MRPGYKACWQLEHNVHMNHERRAKPATSTAERSRFHCKELVTTSHGPGQGWRFFRPRR